MAVFERFLFVLIGLALIAAALLGVAIYYHFSRFSPDRTVTITTIRVYGVGLIIMTLLTLIMMIAS